MQTAHELLLVEPDANLRDIIETHLHSAPEWEVVAVTTLDAASDIAKEMKNGQGSRFDAAIIDSHLCGHRTPEGRLLTTDEQLDAAQQLAQLLQRVHPKIGLLVVGNDTDILQEHIGKADDLLYSLGESFAEIPKVLEKLANKIDTSLFA